MTFPPPARDVDRQRVYDAEEAAFGGTSMAESLSWEEVMALTDAVAADPWWITLDIRAPRVARTRSDATSSSADGATVRLSADGRDGATIVHELAHHLSVHLPWPVAAQEPPHGPRFRAVALRTAMVVGGSLATDQLATAWDQMRLTVAEWCFPEPEPRQGRALRGVIALGS